MLEASISIKSSRPIIPFLTIIVKWDGATDDIVLVGAEI